MRALVWRYVAAKHRKMEEEAVTEDDINEVKGDISALRYELLEIFEKNGMDVSAADRKEKAVLAKRMKVWERRLMKDFHVAPVEIQADILEEDEGAEEAEEVDANPLARFRRIALKVASQTNAAKWGQVMSGVGFETNSQIGRCKTRDSYRQQQHLQKAIFEAQRLVQRSPMIRSRSSSPEAYEDETTNTLRELINQFTAETEELTKKNTLHAQSANHRSTTPLEYLTAQLQVALSKSTTPIMTKSSRVGTGERSPSGSTNRSRSPVPGKGPTSPEPTNSTLRVNSPPTVMSPPPDRTYSPVQSPPPTIHITGTGTHPMKKSKSKDSIADRSQTSSPTGQPRKSTETKPAGASSPPQVTKRKAPSPGAAPETSPTNADIAVSRPVATKPQPGQGMLPPPPSNSMVIPTLSTTPATPLPSHKKMETTPASRTSPPTPVPPRAVKAQSPSPPPQPPKPPQLQSAAKPNAKQSSPPQSPTDVNSSTEQLITSGNGDPSTDTASSPPPTLRPIQKIADIKTITRKPKSGWL